MSVSTRQEEVLDQLFEDDEVGVGESVLEPSEEKGEGDGKVELGPEEEKPLKKKRITFKESDLAGEGGIGKLYYELPRHLCRQHSNSNPV